MENSTIPFEVLKEAVLNQLRSQNYMDSTLTVYQRTYNRIHAFLKQHNTEVYTHDLGKEFLDNSIVCRNTLVAYACAVRRLDDYIEGKPYRSHLITDRQKVPCIFSNLLTEYLQECEASGNKVTTIHAKERTCASFLMFLESEGCTDLSQLNTDFVTQALLIFTNKDAYSHIRQFLKYLADKCIMKSDISGVVPRYRRRFPLPTVFTPTEIISIEESIDTNTDIGKRNLAIIRLASRMGFRAGDIAKLQLSEVNFSTGYISIYQEKTGFPLSVQMPCEVSDALLMHLENDKYSSDDGYVFHSMKAPYGRITTSSIRHALNEAIVAAKVNTTGKKHGPHALRSSLASSMINDGVSYEVVRHILGHTDPNVIKHYAKVDIENLRLCAIEPPTPTGRFWDYLFGKEVINRV